MTKAAACAGAVSGSAAGAVSAVVVTAAVVEVELAEGVLEVVDVGSFVVEVDSLLPEVQADRAPERAIVKKRHRARFMLEAFRKSGGSALGIDWNFHILWGKRRRDDSR